MTRETVCVSRRTLLGWVASGAAAWALPAALRAATVGERSLAFVHTHTGESGRITYWAEGDYLADGLAALRRLLRDHYSGDEHAIDVQLLDCLHRVHATLDTTEPFHVISGYRSPETNAALAARSGGIAQRSLHMLGQAIDVRIPGRSLASLRDSALALRAGGVGYYAGPDFVHIDVGRVRRW
ncbi:MAG TPA: DUF882 domain-containing protein [Myxococcota bacterium]|nr:DUF882 domain-containing protein [Myxococcota bacterium]